MNIGFLATFPNPNDPNTSKAGYRHVIDLIKLLSPEHKITLYSIHKYKWNVDLPFCEDIIYLRSSNLVMRWIKTVKAIVKHRRMTDIFIIYNPTINTFPVIPLKWLFPIPIIVDYVDKQGSDIQSQNRIMRFINLVIEKLFLVTISNWLTDSSYLESEIRKVKKNANIMYYRGVCSAESSSDTEVQSLPLEIEDGKVKIAYSGGLYHFHGVDILLDAFSKLPLQNVHLYITGSGPMKSTLEKRVRREKLSNISFIYLDNNMVSSFLGKMDILVMPHRMSKFYAQGFSSKIIGYIRAGKAIIVTKVGELSTFFEDGKTAVLIEPDNEPALREALMGLVTNEEKRKRLGFNARKYFEDNFSEEVVKPKINKYLADIVKLQ